MVVKAHLYSSRHLCTYYAGIHASFESTLRCEAMGTYSSQSHQSTPQTKRDPDGTQTGHPPARRTAAASNYGMNTEHFNGPGLLLPQAVIAS